SNVGKSSLINGLMNRKNYARTSQEPGKTQTINYYNINDEFYLVDLPGYGFARVSQKTKEQWGKMIENYLHTSRQLLRVFLLIDIRHEPSANDVQMYKWIVHQGFQPVIIATKLDKLKKSQRESHINMLRNGLGLPEEIKIFPYSALSKEGRQEIYDYMDELLAQYRE
ncbi:MAG: YihA family ribosome biogenesis GTP-binding protein, partial [Butyrivibrio sp.]|nr:YihA family ribosome biogenesis GTP-binding protein [Butyrivibrio sp.]